MQNQVQKYPNKLQGFFLLLPTIPKYITYPDGDSMIKENTKLYFKKIGWDKVLTAFHLKKKSVFWGSITPHTPPTCLPFCNPLLPLKFQPL